MSDVGQWRDRAPEQKNWTTVGAAFTGEQDRERLVEEIATLDWHDFDPEGMRLPFMPGEGIRAFVDETCGWKGVRKLAWNGAIDYPDPADRSMTAHYGLYGIEKWYANGMARIYLLDTGTSTLCIRSDFWPKEAIIPC